MMCSGEAFFQRAKSAWFFFSPIPASSRLSLITFSRFCLLYTSDGKEYLMRRISSKGQDAFAAGYHHKYSESVSSVSYTHLIRYYSTCWMIGLLLGYLLMSKLYKQQGLSDEKFSPLFLYIFLGVLIDVYKRQSYSCTKRNRRH